MSKNKINVFMVCGRTGGPFFPLPAVIDSLQKHNPNINPILIGVKNSFEQKAALSFNWTIRYLPEAKLSMLSFDTTSENKILTFLSSIADLLWNGFKLGFSFFKCLYLVQKFQPRMIYSTGSFLAVPLFLAAKLTNFVGLTRTKLIVHQQDPIAGISNRFCVKMSDLKSCVFDYTRTHYPDFVDAELITNPILESKYTTAGQWQNLELQNFIKNAKKTKLLIFGGGSGAKFINNWVGDNHRELTSDFDLVHLTGILQKKVSDKLNLVSSNEQFTKNQNYFSLPIVLVDMAILLTSVDFVLCRAGLGTISELEYLHKKAFLVPLPDSHQELNAELVKDKFVILEQKNASNWLSQIKNSTIFEDKVYSSPVSSQDIDKYYERLSELCS